MKTKDNKLHDQINNYSKQHHISQQFLYYRFFFDSFIERLSKSIYKNNFILKGGLYLSSLIGLDNRSTIDIDFLLGKVKSDINNIKRIISDICQVPIEEEVILKLVNIESILSNKEYGGYSSKILGIYKNIKIVFFIDIAFGDPIYPSHAVREYKTIIFNKVININTYSLESFISEKLQTILYRGLDNSRSKDLYDLYALKIIHGNNIDENLLKEAFTRTCNYRNYDVSKEYARKLLNELTHNNICKQRWDRYKTKYDYSKNIDYIDTIDALSFWINKIII